MVVADMDELLKKMGWLDGFQIPISNEENRALEAEVARLCLRKVKSSTGLLQTSAKLEALQKHLKNVLKENEESQKLLSLNKQYLENEEARCYAMRALKENTEQDTRRTAKKLDDVLDRQRIRRNDLTKGASKLEKFKAEITWDAEALEAWEEAIKKRDEDNELLKKFAKQDDSRFKELEAKRQNLRIEVMYRKNLVGKIVADITNYECILERTTRVFNQQIAERDALVRQWQEAVKNLRQRDSDISKMSDDIIVVHQEIANKNEALEEANTFLESQKDRNREAKLEVDEIKYTNARLKREVNALAQITGRLQNEITARKRNLTIAATSLEKERVQNRQLDEEINAKEVVVKKREVEVQEMIEKIEEVETKQLSSLERVRRLEDLLNPLRLLEKELFNEQNRLEASLYKVQEGLTEQTEVTKQQQLAIRRFEDDIKLLRRHERTTFHDVQLAQEALYIMEYRITNLQRKLAKMEKAGCDVDLDELGARLENLEKVFAELSEVNRMLSNQVVKLQEEMNQVQGRINCDEKLVQTLRDLLQDQMLLFEGGRKQMKVVRGNTQQKQVEHSILTIRLDQLDKSMRKENKHIYNSQKMTLELKMAMEQHMLEISANKDVLRAKLRNFDEEKGRLKADVAHRRIRIDQFQKKYELAMSLLGRDEEGNTMTMANFKYKAAQEKLSLRQEGDELDLKIQKAEKEIVAMENTLQMVNKTNDVFKQSLSIIDENCDEVKDLKSLERDYNETVLKLRKLNKEIDEKNKEIKEARAEMKKIKDCRGEVAEKVERNEGDFEVCCSDYMDREEKLARAERLLGQVTKKLSNMKIDTSLYDKDMEIQGLRDANRNALNKLTELTDQNPDALPVYKKYLIEFQVKIPSQHKLMSQSFESSVCSKRSITPPASIASVVLTFPDDIKPCGKAKCKKASI